MGRKGLRFYEKEFIKATKDKEFMDKVKNIDSSILKYSQTDHMLLIAVYEGYKLN